MQQEVPVCLSICLQVALMRQTLPVSNTWILTFTLSILQCKNTHVALWQIWKLPFTLESKICSKEFIFAQFNLFRESSIYDLSWAVHSDKYWSPRNTYNEMSGEEIEFLSHCSWHCHSNNYWTVQLETYQQI